MSDILMLVPLERFKDAEQLKLEIAIILSLEKDSEIVGVAAELFSLSDITWEKVPISMIILKWFIALSKEQEELSEVLLDLGETLFTGLFPEHSEFVTAYFQWFNELD